MTDRLSLEDAEMPWPRRHVAQRRRHIVLGTDDDLRAAALRERGRRNRQQECEHVAKSAQSVFLRGLGQPMGRVTVSIMLCSVATR